MTRLSPTAKAYLRDSGITHAAWARRWSSPDSAWGGDACGCPDDRCIGHHHDATDECGCLDALVREYRAEAAQ